MSTAFAVDPVRRPNPVRPIAPAPVRAAAPAPAAAVLPALAGRPKVLAGGAVLAGTVVVVAAQLLLSIGTANGAYRLAALEQQSDLLARQQQVQVEALRDLAAPQRLAARAVALGMVQDDSPAYLDARTGRVLGDTAAAVGAPTAPGGILR